MVLSPTPLRRIHVGLFDDRPVIFNHYGGETGDLHEAVRADLGGPTASLLVPIHPLLVLSGDNWATRIQRNEEEYTLLRLHYLIEPGDDEQAHTLIADNFLWTTPAGDIVRGPIVLTADDPLIGEPTGLDFHNARYATRLMAYSLRDDVCLKTAAQERANQFATDLEAWADRASQLLADKQAGAHRCPDDPYCGACHIPTTNPHSEAIEDHFIAQEVWRNPFDPPRKTLAVNWADQLYPNRDLTAQPAAATSRPTRTIDL